MSGLTAGTAYKIERGGSNQVDVVALEFVPDPAGENEITLTFAVDEGLNVTDLTVGGAATSAAASVNVAKNAEVTFKVATKSDLYAVDTVKFGEDTLTDADGVYTIADVGGANATVTITASSSRVPATGVTISGDATANMSVGDTVALTATAEPSNTTDKVAWTTGNDKVATVSDGTVTAVAIGKTTVTATAGEKNATRDVTVVGADQDGPVYTFNAGNMGEGNLPDGTVVYDNYFTVTTKGSTVVADTREFGTSEDAWYLSGTQYLAPGTDGNKSQRSVVFTTTAEKSTVEVWWKQNASSDATPVQRDISLDGTLASSLIGTAVDGLGSGETAFTKNSLYHVTFSDVEAGEHYVAAANGGGEYIFQIVVDETEEGTGDELDFTALNAAITAAGKLDTSLPTSTDGSDIDQDAQWVTAKMKNDLTTALTAAEALLTNDEATQDDVDAAAEALDTAVKAYAPANGTKLKTMSVTATPYTGAYDGKAHGITVTVTEPATGATITYSNAADGTFAGTQPEMKNASDTPYTVYYKVTADGYEAATGSATVTINKAAAPSIVVTADPSDDIDSAGGEVIFTATGVPAGTETALVGTCTQASEGVTINFELKNGKVQGVSHVAENTTDAAKTHAVTFTWSDDNYETPTIAGVELTQVKQGDVSAAKATGLSVDDAFASKGVTAAANDTNGVTIAIDEATIRTAFAADKTAFQGDGVQHGDDAYIMVTFDAPENFDKATWSVQQTVSTNGVKGTPSAMWKWDGTTPGNELDVVGTDKIGDWFCILKGVTGDTPTMPAAAQYRMEYKFYDGDGTHVATTYYLVDRTVTAAYTVTVTGGTADKTLAAAGASVKVTADTAPTGKVFDKWTTSDLTLSETDAAKAELTFTMPAKNVTLTATYKDEQPADLTPVGELAEGEYRMSIKGEGAGGTVNCADGVIAGLAWNDGAKMHTDHGFQDVTAFAVKVPDGKTATLTVFTCVYGTGTPITCTKGTATVGASEAIPGSEKDGDTKTVITGVTGTAQFALTVGGSGNYVHCVKVEFEGGGGETVDKAALTAAVEAAEAAIAAITVDTDAANVAEGTKWILAADKATYQAAIDAAKAVAAKADASQTEVGDAVTALATATTAFETAQKDGTKTDAPAVNKDALKADIKAAEDLVKNTAITAQEDNLAGEKYWDSAMKTAYEAVIADAKAVADKADATQDDVDAAKAALAEATTAFKAGKTDGTKVLTGDELKDALAAAITAATTAKDGVVANDATDPADVTNGTKYVSNAVMNALNSALEDAEDLKALLDDEDAENDPAAEDLAAALVALKNATTDFQPETGTKSTSSSGGGKPAIGTGTKPNGETTKTETLGDGTTVTTTTDSEGNTTVVTKRPDGLETTTVTNEDGDMIITTVNDEGVTLAEVKVPGTLPANDQKFVDVPEGHWAEDSINNMAALNMVKGVDDVNHIFDMNSDVTRGSVATILYRFANGKDGMSQNFSDVVEGQWYTDAVAWASNAGVVTGYENGTFQPDGSITREQLAVMIYRYAKLIGLDVSAKGDLRIFTDNAKIQSWAADGMAWCVKNGIINGRGDGTVDPTTPATRAEAAAMLDRFVALLK